MLQTANLCKVALILRVSANGSDFNFDRTHLYWQFGKMSITRRNYPNSETQRSNTAIKEFSGNYLMGKSFFLVSKVSRSITLRLLIFLITGNRSLRFLDLPTHWTFPNSVAPFFISPDNSALCYGSGCTVVKVEL